MEATMPVSSECVSTAAGSIPLDVYTPASSGKCAGVLILHGTLGLDPPFGPDIVSFAEALQSSGVAAAIPQYFEVTHTKPGDEAMRALGTDPAALPAWKTACGAVLSFMAGDKRFESTKFGVLGFSLGGHIALDLAMGRPAGVNLKALVDFFGPTVQVPLSGDWAALPPTLIHHGTADPLSIANSEHVVKQLEANGRKVARLIFGAGMALQPGDQFVTYPGEGHGFKGAALAGSRDATIEFFAKRLK
jgi:dienelactone hydrolase